VPEHVGVLFRTADEFDCRKDVLPRDRKKLEDCSILSSDYDATVHECQGGRNVFTVDLVGSVREAILRTPDGEAGILRYSSE